MGSRLIFWLHGRRLRRAMTLARLPKLENGVPLPLFWADGETHGVPAAVRRENAVGFPWKMGQVVVVS